MDAKRITRASHELSRLLRHGAGEARLEMDAAGWAPIGEVLRRVRISRAELDEVVRENNKSRLELRGESVRACQGHSLRGMPVTLEALEASWEVDLRASDLWHGTGVEALASIARDGLQAGGRTHVHLAGERDSKVGKRAGVDVALCIDPERLRAAGFTLHRSPNGVLLAREVPPGCITGLIAESRRAIAQEEALRALFGAG